MTQPDSSMPLAGRRVAVPESRQLDVLDGLLVRRGAQVLRCPMVGIVDAPDAAPVVEWLRRFVEKPPTFFVLMTGEGLRRLLGFADRAGIGRAAVRQALAQTATISRGPKPARELRRLDLVPAHRAAAPTTAGVIETLEGLAVGGKPVAVQLYGDDPNDKLVGYLERRHAVVRTVAPYRYAPAISDEAVADLIGLITRGDIDAIVFTSQAQVDRLASVAANGGKVDALVAGLAAMVVAGVGPVVADALTALGVRVDVLPERQYFMKPLIRALSRHMQ